MSEADRLTIAGALIDGIGLMRRAGDAVASAALERFPDAPGFAVLAGPRNNGGDGYVVAEHFRRAGVAVTLWRDEMPRAGTDAAIAADECKTPPQPLKEFAPQRGWVVVDALFGAGLDATGRGHLRRGTQQGRRSRRAGSSQSTCRAAFPGLSGAVLGAGGQRRSHRHLLPQEARASAAPRPLALRRGDRRRHRHSRRGSRPPSGHRRSRTIRGNWFSGVPKSNSDTHKYARGHVGVFSGGPASTGAARLAAMAAARAGAGAVTLLAQANALAVNAAHLTSIILRRTNSLEEVAEFIGARKPGALVFGPGLGTHDKVGAFALDLIAASAGSAYRL